MGKPPASVDTEYPDVTNAESEKHDHIPVKVIKPTKYFADLIL
jgi:hypothetical protein